MKKITGKPKMRRFEKLGRAELIGEILYLEYEIEKYHNGIGEVRLLEKRILDLDGKLNALQIGTASLEKCLSNIWLRSEKFRGKE